MEISEDILIGNILQNFSTMPHIIRYDDDLREI